MSKQLATTGKNRFKFISDAARVQSFKLMKLDKKLGFFDCIETLRDLVATTEFTAFCSQLNVQSLEELLFSKDRIMKLIIEFLPSCPSEMIQLTAALSIDLLDEIEPYIVEFVKNAVQVPDYPEKYQYLYTLVKNHKKLVLANYQLLHECFLDSNQPQFLGEIVGHAIDHDYILECITDTNCESTAVLLAASVKVIYL